MSRRLPNQKGKMSIVIKQVFSNQGIIKNNVIDPVLSAEKGTRFFNRDQSEPIIKLYTNRTRPYIVSYFSGNSEKLRDDCFDMIHEGLIKNQETIVLPLFTYFITRTIDDVLAFSIIETQGHTLREFFEKKRSLLGAANIDLLLTTSIKNAIKNGTFVSEDNADLWGRAYQAPTRFEKQGIISLQYFLFLIKKHNKTL